MGIRGLALAAVAACLLAAPVRGQDGGPPPAPPPPGPDLPPAEEVKWPEKEKVPATLPPVAPNKSNGAAKAGGAAIDWLLRHQSADGGWHPAGFSKDCAEKACPGAGREEYATGVTSLALLGLLRAGILPAEEGPGDGVRRALSFLRSTRTEQGSFGDPKCGHNSYNVALVTLALCEAFARTKEPSLGADARGGLDWIRKAQTPYAGWRYEIQDKESDTSATGWMVQALRAGADAGLEVEPRVFDSALSVIEKLTDPETGRTGYRDRGGQPARPSELLARFPPARSESMTASGLLTRLLCGQDRKNPRAAKSMQLLLKLPPAWDEASGRIDLYYWHLATEAAFRFDRDVFRKWAKDAEPALAWHQRGEKDGCARGSWDPCDPWGPDGGRVYATALGLLMVERIAPPKR